MKTVGELLVGDNVYEAKTLIPIVITRIVSDFKDKTVYITVKNKDAVTIDRNSTYIKTSQQVNYYTTYEFIYYTTLYEATFNKQQDLLKELNELKELARTALKRVKAFRDKYYEDLNQESLNRLDKLKRML